MRDVRLAARARESVAEASRGSSIDALEGPDGAVGAFAPGRTTIGVEATFERLADGLEVRIDRLAAAGLGAMRGCVPSWLSPADPSWGQLEDHLRASLLTELACFRAGQLPGELPAVDGFLVDLAAELGDLDGLVAGYRFAQTSLWGAWFELVEGSSAPGYAKQELRARGARFFFRYAELVSRFLAESYRRGMEQRIGLAAQAGGALGQLTEDNPFADAHLDFDFGRYHLGAIVWGGGAAGTARELAARLDRVAQVRARGATWWVCLSGHYALSQRGLSELEAFEPEPGVRLAIGLEGFGEEGLRVSFRQALRARTLADCGSPVTRYADVAVEALALQVEDDVRSFIAHELRGIDDDSAASKRLRETLAAYFASHLNAASAAAQLGVHHQTVANRLRTIEERLGRPLMARTLELALALRLRERMPA